MASFVALNVEPDEDSEEEIDDTKEIQIEEALKLYQNALKLHSQGPRCFEATQAAYDALLGSEIFTYPESLSESKRIGLFGDSSIDEEEFEINVLPSSVVPTGGIDGAPSTLPHILYLSYKNYGQFLLDQLTYHFKAKANGTKDPIIFMHAGTRIAASNIINLFTEALERDDTDIDLWRRTSRISVLLNSQRIARFCLESVLEEEAEDVQITQEPLGIEAAFAKNDLDHIVDSISDHLSKSQLRLLSMTSPQFPDTMKRLMDTCPELPSPPEIAATMDDDCCENQHKIIYTPFATWASLGMSILQHLNDDEASFAVGYLINIPSQEAPNTLKPPETGENDKLFSAVARPLKPLTIEETTEKDLSDIREISKPDEPGTALVDSSFGHEEEAISALPEPLLSGTRPDEPSDRPLEGDIACSSSLTAEPYRGVSVGHTSLPTRKRTLESTGLPDSIDGGRVRSKRIRARVELPDEDNAAAELATNYESQLYNCVQADQAVFDLTNRLLSRLGCHKTTTIVELRKTLDISEEVESANMKSEIGLETATRDFRDVLSMWNTDKSSVFLHGNGLEDALEQHGGPNNSGLTLFLEYSKQGGQRSSIKPVLAGDETLVDFITTINESYVKIETLAIRWLIELLASNPNDSGKGKCTVQFSPKSSIYTSYVWPDALKEIVVQMLIRNDESIFALIRSIIEKSDQDAPGNESLPWYFASNEVMIEFVQAVFEIHLDIYGRITNPSSEVDQDLRTVQRYRVRRWAGLASQAMCRHFLPDIVRDMLQVLVLRHFWATVIHMSITDSASREHIVLCFEDLKTIMKDANSPVVEIQNNAVMPELSIQAADHEISKLSTMDFFMSIFDQDNKDPLAVIESLEPILIDFRFGEGSSRASSREDAVTSATGTPKEGLKKRNGSTDSEERQKQSMMDFLEKSSISLRLFLWRKLRIAYETIQYPPMVFICNMRSVDLILQELHSSTYAKELPENRTTSLLQWLRRLEDLISRSLAMAIDDPAAFECMDEYHLRISLASCADLVKLMHVVALWDDSVRVGRSVVPQQPYGPASTAYGIAMTKLRSLHMKTWTLQYTIVREAIAQNPDSLESPKEDLAEYLKLVHGALGARQYCRLSKKVFLRFMRGELVSLNASKGCEYHIAQVLYDLYGVKLCSNPYGLEEHGCTADSLDRSSAIDMLDFVMKQAREINIKDLLKTDLKSTMDKMQSTIGTPRLVSTGPQAFNKRLITNYLKSPINPIDLYRCLQGIGNVFSKVVNNEYASIVSMGWYFILGYATFAKFRSQKRTSPCPTDDLDVAIAFFRIELEYDSEKWETWYRLGQVYDAVIEEDATWNKINNHKQDLNTLQRNAIHCYQMALAVANRCADDSFDTASKISELYTDFGNRIYASSREPFCMEVFSLDQYSRHFNGEFKGMYKNRPFRDLQLRPAWAFSAVLFRRALTDKPQRWINWYMLGKSLWKMYNHSEEATSNNGYHKALEAFVKAIEFVPERRDSRHPEKDSILEPHYKLVSIVHKLVQRRQITPTYGCQVLNATSYARKVPHVYDPDDWEGYILLVLKSLRSADKSNWHHRMVARAAHVIYDDSSTDVMAAHGAKHELTQQIFTKTMSIQVWKPEHERAGRHFVYTGRYVCFFVRLLFQLGDRVSLEALAKRIRKKSGDFVDHAKIWQIVCIAYLKLLRIQGSIPEAHEETIFKSISHEAFLLNTARLETWASTLTDTSESHVLQLLRETVELKKLNNNLMKSTLVDDLVGDTFAYLYQKVVPDLITKSNDEENRDRMRVDHLLMNTDLSVADAPSPVPSTTPAADQPTTIRTRPKVIGRREIQRKAEALIMKPVAPAPSARAARPPTSTPIVVKQTETLPISADATEGMKDETTAKEGGGSSVPGSVHDSADDESELSEPEDVDEEVLAALPPMFPGLLGRGAGDEEENETESGEREGEGEGEVEGTEAMDVEDEDEVDEVAEAEAEVEAEAGDEEVEDVEGGKVE